jgi:hypothetical protein
MGEAESCWRCGAEMRWVHGTWQCSRCRFKLGCCEGEPQTSPRTCQTETEAVWHEVSPRFGVSSLSGVEPGDGLLSLADERLDELGRR